MIKVMKTIHSYKHICIACYKNINKYGDMSVENYEPMFDLAVHMP